ncbi:interleukin 17-like protein [Argopecten irradians]|uniref:interleukin 17-like protein n=1 Tax=Argopecten irradians TaxID=31199 RepID=UPI003719B8D1
MKVLRLRCLLVLLFQVTSPIVVYGSAIPKCSEPSSERMKNLTHMLLLGNSQWLTYDADNILSEAKIEIMPSLTTNQISTTCPAKSNSTCPSYMVKETVPTRVPSVIIHTRCACDQCQIPKLKGFNKLQHVCEPTYRFIPVLKRQTHCVNGEYDYVIVQQRVAVSCHCVRKSLPQKKGGKRIKRRKTGKRKVSKSRKMAQNYPK